MIADVFDLAPHEREQSLMETVIASEATELPDADPSSDKLPFLSWLWHHHLPEDEFYALAHLVLSGGPGDIWARKTFLVPSFVARDIAEFFAVGRPGVTEEHLDQARKAIRAYHDSTDTVSEMVARRRRNAGQAGNPALGPLRELKDAQFAGFVELDTLPMADNANNPTASVKEVVPDVTEEQMPADFRTVKVRCVYGVARGQRAGREAKMCGRPSVAGSMLCVEHGGIPLAYTQEELREIYNGARQRLISATLMAVDATIELAQNAINETVRLKAAEIILDRTGFVPGVEIHLPGSTQNGTIDKTPAQIILERLSQLGISTPSVVPISNADRTEDEADVVDAEVVEETK
jgi:hypothetical protein